MQLLPLQVSDKLSIGNPVKPLQFQNLLVNGSTAKERDLEDLLVRHPELLNTSEPFHLGAEPDLLFIGQQPMTSTRKRFDLLALDREGALVLVEVKRDASDERARREAMEFQAIRYAAACRTMTAEAVVEQFAQFLEEREGGDRPPPDPSDEGYWTRQARKSIIGHLSEATEDTLDTAIDPRHQLRILLVAADYEDDMLSACAWLLEKGIDIGCLRLRPYQIGGDHYLEREQLIPPPALDDFFVSMADPGERTVAKATASRAKADKPQTIEWMRPDEEVEREESVSSWRAALEAVLRRIVQEDGEGERVAESNSLRAFPLSKYDEVNGTVDAKPVYSPFKATGCGFVFDLHGSSGTIRGYINEALKASAHDYQVRITTKSGKQFNLPSKE